MEVYYVGVHVAPFEPFFVKRPATRQELSKIALDHLQKQLKERGVTDNAFELMKSVWEAYVPRGMSFSEAWRITMVDTEYEEIASNEIARGSLRAVFRLAFCCTMKKGGVPKYPCVSIAANGTPQDVILESDAQFENLHISEDKYYPIPDDPASGAGLSLYETAPPEFRSQLPLQYYAVHLLADDPLNPSVLAESKWPPATNWYEFPKWDQRFTMDPRLVAMYGDGTSQPVATDSVPYDNTIKGVYEALNLRVPQSLEEARNNYNAILKAANAKQTWRKSLFVLRLSVWAKENLEIAKGEVEKRERAAKLRNVEHFTIHFLSPLSDDGEGINIAVTKEERDSEFVKEYQRQQDAWGRHDLIKIYSDTSETAKTIRDYYKMQNHNEYTDHVYKRARNL